MQLSSTVIASIALMSSFSSVMADQVHYEVTTTVETTTMSYPESTVAPVAATTTACSESAVAPVVATETTATYDDPYVSGGARFTFSVLSGLAVLFAI